MKTDYLETETDALSTEILAKKFIHLYRQGKTLDAFSEFFSDTVIQVEWKDFRLVRSAGKALLLAKEREWLASAECIYDLYVSDPVISGNYFSFVVDIEAIVQNKGRIHVNKICVYKTENDKIAFEQQTVTVKRIAVSKYLA